MKRVVRLCWVWLGGLGLAIGTGGGRAVEAPPLPPLPPELPPAQRVPRPVVPSSNPPPAGLATNLPAGVQPPTNLPAFSPARRSPVPAQITRPPPLLARPPEQLAPVARPGLDPLPLPGAAPLNPVQPPAPLRPGYATTPGAVPNIRSQVVTPPQQEAVLAWDGLVKEVNLKPGETSGRFTFAFTNTSPGEVTIHAVRTSCGCTAAKLPPLPWHIPAGGAGAFEVDMDVRGKNGVVTKTVTVETTAGYRYLTVRAAVPAATGNVMAATERSRNLQIALADRQAVLKGDCAACHVTPGIGKLGAELYHAVCGVCHEAEHRASMVPNLRALSRPLSAEEWRRIIRSGKKDSLMPAFAADEDGFMTDEQIESLVRYLTGPFHTEASSVPRPAAVGTLPTH